MSPLVRRGADKAPAGPVARIPPLGDDALQPECAGVTEDGLAIAFQVFDNAQGVFPAKFHLCERHTQRNAVSEETSGAYFKSADRALAQPRRGPPWRGLFFAVNGAHETASRRRIP